jgi:hypothetical protein
MSASCSAFAVGFIIGGLYVVDVICVPVFGFAVAFVFVDGLCLGHLHRWLGILVVGHGETMVLVNEHKNFAEMSIIFSSDFPPAQGLRLATSLGVSPIKLTFHYTTHICNPLIVPRLKNRIPIGLLSKGALLLEMVNYARDVPLATVLSIPQNQMTTMKRKALTLWRYLTTLTISILQAASKEENRAKIPSTVYSQSCRWQIN